MTTGPESLEIRAQRAALLHRLIAPGAEQLAFHVIAVHKNTAALSLSLDDNIDGHVHDHLGPCGLRDHDLGDFSYDAAELEAVLEAAETEGA